jgi:hypothetical protein
MTINNDIMLVVANNKNILKLSLKYCNNMNFVLSSDNIYYAKEYYINNNINLKTNLITTLDTGFDTYVYSINYNKYDNVFNSLLFFSKIINKLYSTENKKYSVIICLEKKHVKRALIISSYLFRNINTLQIAYINTDLVTEEDEQYEKNQLNLFYQSLYYVPK